MVCLDVALSSSSSSLSGSVIYRREQPRELAIRRPTDGACGPSTDDKACFQSGFRLNIPIIARSVLADSGEANEVILTADQRGVSQAVNRIAGRQPD